MQGLPMFDLPKFGKGPCLVRLNRLLDALTIDKERLKARSVVITGSNGKGSTATFCAAIAKAYGLKTGLFTSPHLFRYNERFSIDGVAISDEKLARHAGKIEDAINHQKASGHDVAFGGFEAQFALACLHFQENDTDFMVFEAGIGGRLDPVRLVEAPLTAVVSLDLEHTLLLGDTLDKIVLDKSDACAPGGIVLYGENCLSLARVIETHNRLHARRSIFLGREIVLSGQQYSADQQHFLMDYGTLSGLEIATTMTGQFQINNAALAAALFVEWLQATGKSDAPRLKKAIRAGALQAHLPGRMERISTHPLVVIDAGHTPDGIRQSCDSLVKSYGKQPWILVTGVSADKNAAEIVSLLAPRFDTIIVTRAYHKGTSAERIETSVISANPDAEVIRATTIEEAVAISRSMALKTGWPVFVAGGLFLAAEYAAGFRGENPADLRFF